MSAEYLDEFEQFIRHQFDYLFEQYGFEIILRHISGGEHCLLILESHDCRIKMYLSDGEGNILFGTKSAPLGWENLENGVNQWFYINEVLGYIDPRPVRDRVDEINRAMYVRSTKNEQLAELANRLQPICQQAVQLFRQAEFESKRQEFENYTQERSKELRKEEERRSSGDSHKIEAPPNYIYTPFPIKDPTIGFLNLQGLQATRFLEQDREMLAPLFPSHQVSSKDVPECQVLFLYCSLDENGRAINGSAPIRELIKDAGAYIAVIATDNPRDRVKALGYQNNWGIHLVMVLDRKADNFPQFFRKMFLLMFAGDSMRTARDRLAQEKNREQYPDTPEAIWVSEIADITFQTIKSQSAVGSAGTGLTLVSEHSQPIQNATEGDVGQLFTDDRARGSFIILSHSAQYYVRAVGEGNGPYTLECQAGDGEHHFRSPRGVNKSAAQSAFLKFLHHDPTFVTDFIWEKVEP